MKIIADTHTHTLASGHAYSTIGEIINEAANKGLELVAITDHGPSMPDSPHIWHFDNMTVLPRVVNGVRVLRGAEANIISTSGELDLPKHTLKLLDWVIASFHTASMTDSLETGDYTEAWLGVLENPYVDVLGHSGNPQFPFELDTVLKAAAKKNKIVEINNSSFKIRKGSSDNCQLIALKCKQYGVKVIVNSDAHFYTQVGRFDTVVKLFEEIKMPRELVVNSSMERLTDYLNSRADRNQIIFK